MSQTNLDEHMKALGYFCLQFAILEFYLDLLIQALLDGDASLRRVLCQSIGQIGNRCDFAIKLLYAVPIEAARRDEIEVLINEIRTDLAPNRNRLIHDVWIGGEHLSTPSSHPFQVDERIWLKSPQSHLPKELISAIERERPLQGILDLTERTNRVAGSIYTHMLNYAGWRQRHAKQPAAPPRP